MYGCFDGVIMYGFCMGDCTTMIDPKYIESQFPEIVTGASGVIRNCMGDATYGVICFIDLKTGQVVVSDDDRQMVETLHAKTLAAKADIGPIGFYTAVIGDYETNHHVLFLDDDDEKNAVVDETDNNDDDAVVDETDDVADDESIDVNDLMRYGYVWPMCRVCHLVEWCVCADKR